MITEYHPEYFLKTLLSFPYPSIIIVDGALIPVFSSPEKNKITPPKRKSKLEPAVRIAAINYDSSSF